MRSPRPALQLVLAVVSRPKITLAICLAITAFCAVFAGMRLSLSADQNKLFSAKVPFFRDFLEYVKKFPEGEALYVLIESKDFDAPLPAVHRWTEAADAVAGSLRKLGSQVKRAEKQIPLNDLGDQALVFDNPESVKKAVGELQGATPLLKAVVEGPSPALGRTPAERMFQFLVLANSAGPLARLMGTEAADATEAAPMVLAVARSLDQSLTQSAVGERGGVVQPVLPDLLAVGAENPGRLGYFWTPDETDPKRQRNVLLVRVYPRENYGSLTGLSETVEAIRAVVKETAKDFGEFSIGVTGRPALEADEMRTTDEDSRRAEMVALSAVFVGLVLLLRSFWLALAAELALGVGVAWTCGWATIAMGELNLLSIVFFLALIGIGMDYLVQILSRYRSEMRKAGHNGRRIWVAVFRQVGPPITTSCLGAAGAFLVSLFTGFEGAASLGLIAGGGLILCLIAGYTFLPALLTLVPLRVAGPKEGESRQRKGEARPVEESQERRTAHQFLVGPAIWVGLLAAGWMAISQPSFNPSLLDLQADKLESVKLIRKLPTWSVSILSNDLGALRAAREAVLKRPTVAATESILNAYDNAEWLKVNGKLAPVSWQAPAAAEMNDLVKLADAAGRLAGAYEKAPKKTADSKEASAELRKLEATLRARARDSGEKAAEMVSEWQNGLLGKLRQVVSQASPAGVNVEAIPSELRGHFVAKDGTYALYVYPRGDLWNQAELIRFIEDIEPAIQALPVKVTLTGIAHNIYHSTSAIKVSFYQSTAYAMALIVLLVLIDLRNIWHTVLAVAVLGLGLPMMFLMMGIFGINWNFANFFGLPILIGAAHEYGVFMVHRYRESLAHAKRGWPKWDVADAALLLCAFVTSSSFGFFAFMAHHKGLRSLGLVMALGSGCIYLATVVVVRPVLKWLLLRRERRSTVAR